MGKKKRKWQEQRTTKGNWAPQGRWLVWTVDKRNVLPLALQGDKDGMNALEKQSKNRLSMYSPGTRFPILLR